MRFFAYVYNTHKDVGVDVELEESIPPNIIRIKTEDDSGEYIEIEFDEDDNLKDINNNDDGELNDLLHQAKDILYELSPFSSIESAYDNLKAGEYKEALFNAITAIPCAKTLKANKIATKINKIISKDNSKKNVRIKAKGKYKYATKQEVIDAIEKKYGLKKANPNTRSGKGEAYLARDNKQIREIWDDITEGAEVLEEKPDKKWGYMIKRRKLRDGTIIQLRKKSKSEGSTIEIIKGDGKRKERIKIHNKAREDGDW